MVGIEYFKDFEYNIGDKVTICSPEKLDRVSFPNEISEQKGRVTYEHLYRMFKGKTVTICLKQRSGEFKGTFFYNVHDETGVTNSGLVVRPWFIDESYASSFGDLVPMSDDEIESMFELGE